jgi:uncharacterized protein (DUF736 family)
METKVNSGAIFKNAQKKEDKHPDYKGKINVEGKELEISLWLKTSSKGIKFFGVAISEPYEKKELKSFSQKVQQEEETGLPF